MTLSILSEAKSAPDPDIVDILEKALKDAQRGELTGVVLFAVCRGRYTMSCQAGENITADVCIAFEDWKFRRLLQRNT